MELTPQTQDEREGLPSASNWRRYELCHGSFQLEQEAKRLRQAAYQRPSLAAVRGELIHAWLAGAVDEDGKEIELSEDEQVSADFIQERARDQEKRIFGEEPVTVLNEKRLWLKLGNQVVASGRFDRVVYTDKLALVQDFKTGWSEPDPAETNSQLKVLAVLVGMDLPHVTEVVAQIVSSAFGVTETRFGIKELGQAYHDIVETLTKVFDPQAPLTPSPQACRWCPAINVCPAVKALVPAMKEVEALPDGERGSQLLDQIEVLQKRIDTIREFYTFALTTYPDFNLPGYGLVQGPPRRAVNDWHTARLRLEEYIDAGDLNGAESYQLTSVEKALGKKLKLKGAELKAKLGEILSGLIEEKYPEKSLKRIKGEPNLKDNYASETRGTNSGKNSGGRD